MRIGNLIALLEDVKEMHGDLDVRAGLKDPSDLVTGVWVAQNFNCPFVILATPNKEK
jgi:hypothetical protein